MLGKNEDGGRTLRRAEIMPADQIKRRVDQLIRRSSLTIAEVLEQDIVASSRLSDQLRPRASPQVRCPEIGANKPLLIERVHRERIWIGHPSERNNPTQRGPNQSEHGSCKHHLLSLFPVR